MLIYALIQSPLFISFKLWYGIYTCGWVEMAGPCVKQQLKPASFDKSLVSTVIDRRRSNPSTGIHWLSVWIREMLHCIHSYISLHRNSVVQRVTIAPSEQKTGQMLSPVVTRAWSGHQKIEELGWRDICVCSHRYVLTHHFSQHLANSIDASWPQVNGTEVLALPVCVLLSSTGNTFNSYLLLIVLKQRMNGKVSY